MNACFQDMEQVAGAIEQFTGVQMNSFQDMEQFARMQVNAALQLISKVVLS